MINEEMKLKNFNLFTNKLNQIGVNLNYDDKIKEKITNASFSISNENGCAYDGSLLHIVLRTLTPFALKINELLPEGMRVNSDSIIKVCLLSHISKCEMFIKNDNQWEIEKRGMVYKYAPSNVALKMGARSIIFAEKLGVKFSDEEFEAMMNLDRNEDDVQAKYYSSTLSVIVRQANELTFLQNKFN